MIPVAAPHHPLASIPRPCVPGIIGSLFYPINVRATDQIMVLSAKRLACW